MITFWFVPSFYFIAGHFLLCLHMVEVARDLCYKSTNPFWGLHPHDLITSQITSHLLEHWALLFQHVNWGGGAGHYSDHSWRLKQDNEYKALGETPPFSSCLSPKTQIDVISWLFLISITLLALNHLLSCIVCFLFMYIHVIFPTKLIINSPRAEILSFFFFPFLVLVACCM